MTGVVALGYCEMMAGRHKGLVMVQD